MKFFLFSRQSGGACHDRWRGQTLCRLFPVSVPVSVLSPSDEFASHIRIHRYSLKLPGGTAYKGISVNPFVVSLLHNTWKHPSSTLSYKHRSPNLLSERGWGPSIPSPDLSIQTSTRRNKFQTRSKIKFSLHSPHHMLA